MWPLLTVLAFSLVTFGCRPSTDLVVAPQRAEVQVAELPAVPPPRSDGRLPDEVRPRRYRWTLEVDPAGRRFRGEVRIALEVVRPTRAVVLHASGLTFNEIELGFGDRLVTGRATMRRAAGVEGAEASAEELVIESPEVITAGQAELRIAYEGALDDTTRGLYRSERDGKRYLFTQLEPADARRVLPCFDEPSFKVPFEISVLAPRGQRVFANAKAVRERDAGEDPESGVPRVRTDFEETRPLPTYLLAFAVGPFDVFDGPTEPVPVRMIAPAGLAARGAYVVAMASELVQLFERRFGSPYPYSKLDLVAVPDFEAGAMENAGLILFREELLLVDPTSSALERRHALQVMAHELAHQWFGNLVTLRWWDDLWLNEGFASYYESLVADEWRPETRAELEEFAQLGRVMALDGLDAARRVREPVRTVQDAEEAFDPITYAKGSALLGMIADHLGEGAFQRGVQAYLARHAHGGASSEDLFRALGDEGKLDVGTTFRSFVEQPGVPLVRVTASCVDGVGSLRLEQQRYRRLPRSDDGSPWSIPVCVRYAPRNGLFAGALEVVETSRACTTLEGPVTTLKLESCAAWVLPSDDHRGYYRYALPADAMRTLARAMRGSDVRARVGFLSNAWALVEAGEFGLVDLLAILEEFRGDRAREVVELVVEVLSRIDDSVIAEEARASFDRWVASLLGPIHEELGWEAKPGEPESHRLLREVVLDALARHEPDRKLKAEAARRAKAYLREPASVPVDIAGVALRVAARTGGIAYEPVRAALGTRSEPEHRVRILRALGSFGDAEPITRALDLVLSGEVRATDLRYVARGAARGASSRRALIDWLEAHFAELAKELGPGSAAELLSVVERGCSAEERGRAAATFRPLLQRAGSPTRRLDEALEGAAACTELRRREEGSATRWLGARAGERRER